MKKMINLKNDFGEFPAGRYFGDGDYSGEKFRENFVIPALLDDKYDVVEIDIDGTPGYGSSFLEEAFGGLLRNKNITKELINRKLIIISPSKKRDSYINMIWKYIEEEYKRAK